jgi:hypothetical protein
MSGENSEVFRGNEAIMEILDFRARPRTCYYYRDLVPEPIQAFKEYFKIYHLDGRMALSSLVESVEEMKNAGLTKAVILAGNIEGCEIIHEDILQYPEFFIGLTDVDITKGPTKTAEDLERAFNKFGMHGLSLSPFISGVYPTDPRYYPCYALCESMGKVVQIHASTHFNPLTELDLGNPLYIDKLAVHFPNMKLVLSHAGIGFGNLGITVAQRNPNMFIDFTGLRPKYLPSEMLNGINSFLSRKAIFGTSYPCLPYNIVEEWKALVRPEVQPYFFYHNAARALGLDKD